MAELRVLHTQRAERKTPQDIIEMIDDLRAQAELGVITAIAATWILDGEVQSNYGHEAGEGMHLNGAVQSLALEVNHDMTFED